MHPYSISFAAIVLASLLVGCGPTAIKPEETLQVTGTVMLTGKPCREAEISFQGMNVETNGRAMTNAQGAFIMDGLMPGEYRVTIFRMSSDGQSVDPAFEKYAGKDSELRADVVAENDQFEFNLGD